MLHRRRRLLLSNRTPPHRSPALPSRGRAAASSTRPTHLLRGPAVAAQPHAVVRVSRPGQHPPVHVSSVRHTPTPSRPHTRQAPPPACLHAHHSLPSSLLPLSPTPLTCIALSQPLRPQRTSATTHPPSPLPPRASPIPRLSPPPLPPTHIVRIDGRAQVRQHLHRLRLAVLCSQVQGRSSLHRGRRVGSSQALPTSPRRAGRPVT